MSEDQSQSSLADFGADVPVESYKAYKQRTRDDESDSSGTQYHAIRSESLTQWVDDE